jgi:hypothetical protein
VSILNTQKGQTITLTIFVEFISINLASEAEAIALLFRAYKLHAGATRKSPH